MKSHDVIENSSSCNSRGASSSAQSPVSKFPPTTDEQVLNMTHSDAGSPSDVRCSSQQEEGLDKNLFSSCNNNDENEQSTTAVSITTDSDTFVLEIENNAAALSNPTSDGYFYSLAYAPSMPRWIRISFFCLALLTHGLFLYGQTAPMWRLVAMGDVDVWANATSPVSRSTFDAVGMKHSTHLFNSKEYELGNYTYGHFVERLWNSGKKNSKAFWPRLSALLLIFASGIWPHLKLLLLQVCWFFPRSEKQRSKELYWLGAFGKWSMADIFVVCIMVAVVNFHWNVDAVAMKVGVMSRLPTVIEVAQKMFTTKEACTKLLRFPCDGDHVPWDHQARCLGCEVVVDQAYSHPGWAEKTGEEVLKGIQLSGGGTADLRVEGMRGVYTFCAAVIASLLLGVYADVFDHRLRTFSSIQRKQQQQQQQQQPQQYQHQYEPVLLRDRICHINNIAAFSAKAMYIKLVIAVLITAFIVVLATFLPTMERRLLGAGPTLVQDVVGIEFRNLYSFHALAEATGAAGGWDKLLMNTFMVFIVIGPVVRGILCGVYLSIPLTKSSHQKLLFTINFIGSFCAWEVFTVALIMVDMQMPSQTSSIYRRPECNNLYDDGSCLQVEFNVLHSYALIFLGGLLLAIFSIISVKLGFIALDPYNDGDKGGPYWFDRKDIDFYLKRQPQQWMNTELPQHSLLLQQEPTYDQLTTSDR